MTGIAQLSVCFDDPDTREKPLSEREPITQMLAATLRDIIAHVSPDMVVEVGAFEAAFSQ